MNILVLGDSHSKVFEVCNNHTSKVYFDTLQVGAATGYGLENKQSKSMAYQRYLNKIEASPDNWEYAFLALGEVDCGYLIWARSLKNKISIVESMNNSISSMESFCKEVLESYFDKTKIVLIGAPLQAIKDTRTCMIPARQTINTSQFDRTFLTIVFNYKLQLLATEHGYNYLDITKDLIDEKTMIIKEEFCLPGNNHLKLHLTRPLWIKKISEFLNIEHI